ncbi:MAG: GNAT family N-acyltransferase [Pseudomonadota bacterium]
MNVIDCPTPNISANASPSLDPESPLYNRYTGLRVGIARSDADLSAVYHLRYQAYLAQGAIEPKPVARFIDRYDLTQTALQLMVTEHGRLVGALRLAFQPPTGVGIADYPSSPEFIVFPDVLDRLDYRDRPISSGSRLCIEDGHPKRSQIALLLMMALIYGSYGAGAGWGIASARGSHVAFYRRILMMDPMCDERPMPGLNLTYRLMATDVMAHLQTRLSKVPTDCRWFFEAAHPTWGQDVRDALPTIARGEPAWAA